MGRDIITDALRAAAAELADDLIRPEGGAGSQGHGEAIIAVRNGDGVSLPMVDSRTRIDDHASELATNTPPQGDLGVSQRHCPAGSLGKARPDAGLESCTLWHSPWQGVLWFLRQPFVSESLSTGGSTDQYSSMIWSKAASWTQSCRPLRSWCLNGGLHSWSEASQAKPPMSCCDRCG